MILMRAGAVMLAWISCVAAPFSSRDCSDVRPLRVDRDIGISRVGIEALPDHQHGLFVRIAGGGLERDLGRQRHIAPTPSSTRNATRPPCPRYSPRWR